MFIEFNESAATETQGNAGSKVLDTGVYDVTILTASKTVAKTGTVGIDWSLQVDGHKYPNMVYGFWVQKADGTPIFNMNTVQSLMGIVGAKGLTEYDKEIDVKDGKKTVKAFKELDNVKCKVVIQKVYDYYNGEVTEKNEIKAFLTTDGKTFAESKSNSEAKQLAYYQTKLKDSYTKEYKKAEVDGELNKGTAEGTSEKEESSGSLL
jgi:hypothetical protein